MVGQQQDLSWFLGGHDIPRRPRFSQVSQGLCYEDAGITKHYGRSSAKPELVPGRTLIEQEKCIFFSNIISLIYKL